MVVRGSEEPEDHSTTALQAERDGLFCAKIFGPVKDTSACAASTSASSTAACCEKCGVEVTQSRTREPHGPHRARSPTAHIWFPEVAPSRIGLMLDMTLRENRAGTVLRAFVVIDPGLTPMPAWPAEDREMYLEAIEEHGDELRRPHGARRPCTSCCAPSTWRPEIVKGGEEMAGTSSETKLKRCPAFEADRVVSSSRATSRVDGHDGAAGAAAGSAAAGAARWRGPLRPRT